MLDARVIDTGDSHALDPTSHNCPSFAFGVEGPRLVDCLRTQAHETTACARAG